MAGHSKWANIKHKKKKEDRKRAKLFAKLVKEIMVAARLGDPDPEMNPRLRLAVDKAKANSMPKENIERAIAKASGELLGEDYETITYEGFGPNGVAVMVECLTDNRNRTAADVRHAFSKGNGSMGQSGSVSYMFTRKGVFRIPRDPFDEDTVMMAALEGHGEDVEAGDDAWVVTSAFEDYDTCKKAMEELVETLDDDETEVKATLDQMPDTEVRLEGSDAQKLLDLVDLLEDLDDVQDVYTNADIDPSELDDAS